MEFQEKITDKNIAELCLDYDKIRGANVNIARITPDVIDGLKPVQRRAIYVMSLQDDGKKFRKLASISGDTFGRIHPHCLHGDTKFLLQSGEKITIEKMYEKGGEYKVWSYDAKYKKFVGTILHDVRITKRVGAAKLIFFEDSDVTVTCTEDHQFLNSNLEWIEAKDLLYYSLKAASVSRDNPKPSELSTGLKIKRVIDVTFVDKETPMYDFTVDKYENAVIYLGCDYKDKNPSKPIDRYIIAHNSPTSIDDAIVNITQPWVNQIPLIDGGGNWGCHDRRTEVLTREGWKLFKDVTMEDELASVNPKTGELIYEHPTKLFEYDYQGDMYAGQGKYINFLVTPNHKMLIKKFTKKLEDKEFHFVKAEDLPIHSKLLWEVHGDPNDENLKEKWFEKEVLMDKRIHVHKVKYNGKIYCAKVPTYHTLVTRRLGCVLISGNSVSGAEAGASRYIKAKLSDYTIACFFEDWKDSVVDMTLGADEKTMEPLYLPAKYPNVLLNGCLGIGYGMSSFIPTFNFKEVVMTTINLMRNPNSRVVLIPDSPTGCDVIEGDFAKLCSLGTGKFMMRFKYEVDPKRNIITISNLPYMVSSDDITYKIADIKDKNGLPELVGMSDHTKETVHIDLFVRDDVNPYKFIKKLIKEVPDLQKTYPVTVTAVNDYRAIDYPIRDLLLDWIQWRREQKRVVMVNKYARLLAEQKTNDIKIFLLDGDNLENTIKIFRSGRNKKDIENKLVERYRDSEIHMDSLQAKTLSELRMYQLSVDEYEKCLELREKLKEEIDVVKRTLDDADGIDKLIIAELRDGVKRFGTPRRSNLIPYNISTSSEIEGFSILQLSSDGFILRKDATNIGTEPVPTDVNGFALRVENDSSFILIDENGYHTFIKVNELPLDSEVPVNRYGKNKVTGNIVALLPFDIESDKTCTLISRKGMLKRFKISEMKPSKKPFISLDNGDKLVRGIVTKIKSSKDLLIYTKDGMGQRLDPNGIRITSPIAKGTYGFKLTGDDEIIGCYSINPDDNQCLLYVTTKGKMRLNNIQYLPTRESKHDRMVKLISINDRDHLLSIVGCNKLDKVKVFFDDQTDEDIDLSVMPESTMGEEPKKYTKKNAVSNNIVKVKLI